MAKRRNHDAVFKARVALETVKAETTAAELATAYGVHPMMIHQWKKALLDGATGIFERGLKKTAETDKAAVRELHAKIGELAVTNDFCRKSSSPGPGSEAQHDRAEAPQTVDWCAMLAAVDRTIVFL